MIFNSIQRFRHSRGYGVHSPFAFNFITNVVYEKHWYYAYTDFEYLLLSNGIDIHDYSFYQLSYRLIRFLKPKSLLEINFKSSANSLFICHPDKDLTYYSIGKDDQNITLTNKLLSGIDRTAHYVYVIDSTLLLDAIFLDTQEDCIGLEELFLMSSKDAFWVLKGINSNNGKKLWRALLNDDRARITFDKKDVGIVFLNNSYEKQNYLI